MRPVIVRTYSPALLCVNFNYGTLCEFMHHFAYFHGVTGVEEFGSSLALKNVLECTRQMHTVDDIFYSRARYHAANRLLGRYNATSETMLRESSSEYFEETTRGYSSLILVQFAFSLRLRYIPSGRSVSIVVHEAQLEMKARFFSFGVFHPR